MGWTSRGRVLGMWKFVTAGIPIFLFVSCAGNRACRDNLIDMRKSQRQMVMRDEALSRENSILAEEKSDLEKDVAALRDDLERERKRGTADRASHKAYERSTQQRLTGLEDSLEDLRDEMAEGMDSLRQSGEARVDSLKKRATESEAGLRKEFSESVHDAGKRQEQLHRLQSQYDRDRYAWDRMKDELFQRLASLDRQLARVHTLGDSINTDHGSRHPKGNASQGNTSAPPIMDTLRSSRDSLRGSDSTHAWSRKSTRP